jgi:hypothetical protein
MIEAVKEMKIGKSGETVGDLRDQGRCPICAGVITKHDKLIMDKLSRREHEISGLCQKCQDAIFSPPK